MWPVSIHYDAWFSSYIIVCHPSLWAVSINMICGRGLLIHHDTRSHFWVLPSSNLSYYTLISSSNELLCKQYGAMRHPTRLRQVDLRAWCECLSFSPSSRPHGSISSSLNFSDHSPIPSLSIATIREPLLSLTPNQDCEYIHERRYVLLRWVLRVYTTESYKHSDFPIISAVLIWLLIHSKWVAKWVALFLFE